MINAQALHHITVLELKMRYAKMCDEIFATDYVSLEDLCLAISALEKQIPQKPVCSPTKRGGREWICACGAYLMEIDKDNFVWGHKQDYCEDCGQRLDWSETNETD